MPAVRLPAVPLPAARTRLLTGRTLALLAGCTLALLTGCGSGDSEPAPEAPPSAEQTTEHGSFAQCLTEHGIPETAVSPLGPPDGVDPEAWDAAMEDCKTFTPGPAGP